jgi:hypothetical protein
MKKGFNIFLGVILLLLVMSIGFYLYKIRYKPKPGSCLILEEKYCDKGVFFPHPLNPQNSVVAFKLPKGTKIFTPDNGLFSASPKFILKKEKDKTITHSGLSIKKGTNQKGILYGFITGINQSFIKLESESETKEVLKGELLVDISDINVNFFGNYNLIFTLKRFDQSQEKSESNQKEIKKIFNLIKLNQ